MDSINSAALRQEALRYDNKTILLHWLTAMFVALAWGMAQIIDYFPSGWPRVDARSVHIVLGVAVGVVLAVRVIHRNGAGRELPPAGDGLLLFLAKATHIALYLIIAAMVVLGVMYASARGDLIFGLFTMPGAALHALRHTIGSAHALLANVILAVVGLHAAAALAHHFFWRDGVLRRMLPGPS